MYIGEKEIKSANNGLVEFKDETKEEYSEEYLKYFTSEKSMSIDEFKRHKTHKIISDIMNIFVSSNSNMDEITAIMDGLWSSIEHAKDVAICKKLGAEHTGQINFKTINDVVLEK